MSELPHLLMFLDLGDVLEGLRVAVTPENILAAFAGALIGTAIGVLPGISPTVAIALLLVPTASLPPETGLIVLAAVFFGIQYGDSMSAILMNVPGEATAVVIAIEGFPLTKKGQGGPALAVAAVAAFIGGTIGLIGLTLFAPLVADLVFKFGPVEITALIALGLVALSRVAASRLPTALIAIGIGVVVSAVGLDPVTSQPRFTFDVSALYQGLGFIPLVLGLIGMSELIQSAVHGSATARAREHLRIGRMRVDRSTWKRSLKASGRGGGLGFGLGLVPGPSLTLASFAAYRVEKQISRHPERFGHGEYEGVAAPQAADEAAVCGNLATLLTIGIPFSPVTGVLYAGFLMHGVQPGPLLIENSPDVFWGLVAAMGIGNVALLVLNYPLAGLWVNLLRIPPPLLTAALSVIILVGSFSLRNSQLDMLVTAVAGVAGYLLHRAGIPRIVVILVLLLGPLAEQGIRQSMTLSGGDPSIFVTQPISAGFVAVMFAVLLLPAVLRRWAPRRRRGLLDTDPDELVAEVEDDSSTSVRR